MKLENLNMYPFNTSLMGVLKGIFDFYRIPISNAMLYGGSGHAFLINIHKVICPSGPYCWNYSRFVSLIKNLGIEVEDLGFYDGQSKSEDKKRIEAEIRKHLEAGHPCSAINMENQIINGYDDNALLLVKPWDIECDFTPTTLTYETWAEFGKEIHVNFFTFKKAEPVEINRTIKDSLTYALELYKNPGQHLMNKDYAIGLAAYDNWQKGVRDGHGSSHGNWWNATVWSECRLYASAYFAEIAARLPVNVTELAQELYGDYYVIGDLLALVSSKEMENEKKIEIIQKIREKEEKAAGKIEKILKNNKE